MLGLENKNIENVYTSILFMINILVGNFFENYS